MNKFNRNNHGRENTIKIIQYILWNYQGEGEFSMSNNFIDLGSSLWSINGIEDAVALFNQLNWADQYSVLADVANDIGIISLATMIPAGMTPEQETFCKESLEKLNELLSAILPIAKEKALDSFIPVI